MSNKQIEIEKLTAAHFLEKDFDQDRLYLKCDFIRGLLHYLSLSPTPYRDAFLDVESSMPFADYFQAAWDEKLIDDEQGNIDPSAPMTPAEMGKLISSALDIPSAVSVPAVERISSEVSLMAENSVNCGQAALFLTAFLDWAEREIFIHPTMKYRLHPMEHDISEDVSLVTPYLADTGAGGGVINCPWKDGWNENSENIKKLHETARNMKSRGMGVWMYDEVWYPSGWANGYIDRQGKDYIAKNIGVLIEEGEGEKTVSLSLPENGFYFIKAFCCVSENGTVDYHNLQEIPVEKEHVTAVVSAKKWRLLAFFIRKCNVWPYSFATDISEPIGPRKHLNFLNKDAVAAYIEGALKKVSESFLDFGHLFDAMFTDEPALESFYIYGDRNKPAFHSVPYGEELFEEFQTLHGYDLKSVLPYLFFDNSVEAKTVRIHYYQTVASLLRRNFTGQVQEFCQRNHIRYSGHLQNEEGIYFHVGNYGDYMRVISNMDWPGFDNLAATHSCFWEKGEGLYGTGHFMSGKYTSSVSREKGINTTMVECCPCNDQEEMHKNTLWHFLSLMTDLTFIGATHINTYGYRFLNDNNHFNHLNEYVGRLCGILRNAVSDAKIGIFYPIADVQAHMYATDTTLNEISFENVGMNNYLENLAYDLFLNKLDFNFVTGQAIEQAPISTAGITIGQVTYKVILLPNMEVVSLAALQKLEQFVKMGGAVYFLDRVPQMGERADEHTAVAALAEKMARAGAFQVLHPGNLAFCKPVQVSSVDAVEGSNASYVTDGAIQTDFSWEGWVTSTLPAELVIDLEEEKEFNRLDFFTKTEYEQTEFTAYYWKDNEWAFLTQMRENTKFHRYFTFPAVTSSKIKLCFTKGNVKQPDIARVSEVQLYLVRDSGRNDGFMAKLRRDSGETLCIERDSEDRIFAARYQRNGRPLYYLINRSMEDAFISFRDESATQYRLYEPETGTIRDLIQKGGVSIPAGRGILIELIKD